MTPLLPTLLTLFTLARPPETPLRQISTPLLDSLEIQDISPPLPRTDPTDCIRGQVHSPWQNPFSKLTPLLARRHSRVTLTPAPATVEYRDSLVIEANRTLAWTLTPLERPRLELAYRVFPCKGGKSSVKLIVRALDTLGTWQTEIPLDRGKTSGDSAFHELEVDLPIAADLPARLELELVTTSKKDSNSETKSKSKNKSPKSEAPVVVLAEPAITGLAPSPTLADTNILWIVIDAARHDSMGPARSFEPTATPEMDRRIFSRGSSFTAAYTLANQTRTSTVAMLASLPASIGGFHSHAWAFTSGRRETFYEKSPPLLPLVLESHGFRTVHIGNNHFLWNSEVVGLDHGFSRAVDIRAVPKDAVESSLRAIRYFEQNRDKRWMMFLNYTAPHTPYKPPEPFLELAQKLDGKNSDERLGLLPRSYVGELMWVDHNIKNVFDSLESLGLLDRTLIIVTADHGEVMNPAHDCVSARLKQPCFFNHSLTVYDDELRVPLAFALPGRILENQVIDTPISHADLAPTILDLLGLPLAPGQVGRSLRPALERGATIEQLPIYADGRLAAALRKDDWKLIVHAPQDDTRPRTRMVDGDYPKHELFDLRSDPLELKNLALAHPDITAKLVDEMKQTRQHHATLFSLRTPTRANDLPTSDEPDRGYLMLHADDRPRTLTGTLTSSGTVTCETSPPSCTNTSPNTLAIDLLIEAQNSTTLSFQVSPPGSTMSFSLSLDKEPIPTDRLRLGAWGLALLRPGETLDTPETLALATSTTPPIPQPREAAIYFWHIPGNSAVAPTPVLTGISDPTAPDESELDPSRDKALQGEVKKIMKGLGYTH
jgi:arylsulfatase A-like enzyme